MKNIIFLLVLIPSFLCAEDFPFEYERMKCNFNGIAFNDNSILVYGDGSIVLRSTDLGESWQQTKTLHDSLTIENMIYHDNAYYGIMDKDYMIVSNDNGRSWQNIRLGADITGYDLTVNDNILYLLTEDFIISYNTDLQKLNEYPVDPLDSAREILSFDNKLFVPVTNGRIRTFDLSDNFKEEIIDFQNMGFCSDCTKPYRIKKQGENLYVKLSNNLYKSSDSGDSWQIFINNIGLYNFYESRVYELLTKNEGQRLLVNIELYSITTFQKNKITEEKSDRYADLLVVNDFEFINEDVVIAAGSDKLITISTDGGKSWEIKSNLHFQLTFRLYWVDSENGYIFCPEGKVFTTKNGGVTWLPQRNYNPNFRNFDYADFLYFEKGGKGIIFDSQFETSNDFFMVTFDHGETYETRYFQEMEEFSPGSPPIFLKIQEFYYLYYEYIDNSKTTIYKLDSDFRFVEKFENDSILFREIISLDNDEYLALALKKGRCHIMYSGNGIDWEPDFTFNLRDTNVTPKTSCLYEDFLIFRGFALNEEKQVIERFLFNIDLQNKSYKRLFPEDTTLLFKSLLNYQDKIFISNKYSILVNENYNGTSDNWKTYDTFNNGTYFLFSNDSLIYIQSYNSGSYNLYKLFPITTTSVDNQTELATQFWANPPYPNPALSHVSAEIYWDKRYDIDKSQIAVHDLYGNKIEGNENITINKYDSYHGKLRWNCSSVTNGIYFIIIRHGDAKRVITVVVSK